MSLNVIKRSPTELLRRYASLELENANEAATRLKVIDHILRDVLGWTDDDIDPEEHVTEDGKTTYSDYILRTANTAIVVEAKKAGAAFVSKSGSRRIKLSSGFLQSELGEAIVQARDYARKFGIDFAVATNGSTWAVFPAQRHDQVKFQDSTALVFWSLNDALHENFKEFHDLLSREAVISGSLETILLGRIEDQVEHRKLNSFFSTSAQVNLSNPAFHIIDNEITLAFSDSIVELDDSSFEKCYVASPESLRFDQKIRMHVNRREPVVSGAITRALKGTDSTALVHRIQASALGKKPLAILLLGTVGAGKTTFLHYMRKVRLKDALATHASKPYPHWVHLDFLNNAPSNSAANFIYDKLKEYIVGDAFLHSYERCLRHAYADEIRALKSGPLFTLKNADEKINERISDLIMSEYKDTKPYVDRIIKYATKHAAFFLVIDNVDQIEDEVAQSALFTEALAIARALSINLVLCLRQSTFAKHRNSPGIDAFDFEAVQVDPPRITSVISKRFNLVRFLCEGKRGEFVAENGAKIKVENATQIVDLLQGSVLGTEIGTRIEVLATEDVRLALRMTREFLERGYTNPGRAIEFHRRTGKYVLPRHEAFRAIILGTRRVYDEDFSAIGNPFDSRLSVTQAQLLRLFVLSAVVAYASEGSFRFLDGSSIAESLRKIGFGDNFTSEIIIDLCRHRFLFTSNHGEASIASSVVPSRLGGYVIRDLLANFTFIENTMFDTYIADVTIWQQLRELSTKIEGDRNTLSRVSMRVERAKLFYQYMRTSFSPLIAEAQRRGLPAQWCQDCLAEREADFRNELNRVLSSARNTDRRIREQILQSDDEDDMSNV
jgi:hypothetical protein